MAERKPLFMSVDGFSEEMATSDTATFGGLTLGGAIAMGGNKITGLGDPTVATDAANKQYVDAVASGLDLKASVRLATAAALPAYTAAGSGVGKTLTGNANGVLLVDGVTVASSDRVLVKDQAASHVDHGIYLVTQTGSGAAPFILTRATDFDHNAEVTAGAFTFVAEGTVNADTGWVLTTNDTITIDTTGLAFSQFSATSSLTFGLGLLKTGANVDVELDTAANAQGAGAGGGSAGLEFDVNSAAGKLRAAVNATAGLERTASGLGVRLNGTTLQSAAAGLSVKGLPSLFEINSVAVGAAVTAPNLDTLTNGSDASALHIHQNGEAGRIENSLAVNEAIALADAVFMSTVNDRVAKARADTNSKANVLGVARTAQATVGNTAEIVSAGPAIGVLTGATAGNAYYLQATGGIGTTVPGAANRVIQVGVAKNTTDLFVRIVDYGRKAA